MPQRERSFSYDFSNCYETRSGSRNMICNGAPSRRGENTITGVNVDPAMKFASYVPFGKSLTVINCHTIWHLQRTGRTPATATFQKRYPVDNCSARRTKTSYYLVSGWSVKAKEAF